MKKTLSIILFLYFATGINAQSTGDFFLTKDTVVGKTIDGNDIVAKYYKPQHKIYRWHWNGISDNLLLELRETNRKGTLFKNEGSIAMIDLNDKSVKWSKKVNYNNSETKLQDKFLFLSEKKNNFRLDPETGNVIWENRNDFYFIDPKLSIGVGYPTQSTSNKLSAVDLTNGNTLWTTTVDRTRGWDDAYMLSDSVLLVAVNGIQALNLSTGNGWTYKATTSQKKIGKMIATNAAGILLGVLTGTAIYQTSPDEVTEMNSNMLIDDENSIVLASRNMISRVANTGEILWSTPLPEKITSKSSVFLKDSVIYMINRGYAFYNGGFSMVGDPYFAAFNLNDGSQRYLNLIFEKKEFIRNFQVINDMLFLVFENKIAIYSLAEGNLLTEKIIGLEKGEQLDAFIELGIYVPQSDSTFMDIAVAYPEQNLMMTSENRVLSLTDSLETLITYDKKDVFEKTIDNGSFILLTNDEKEFIGCDSFGKPMMKFRASPNMFVANNKLYAFDKDSFWELDLTRFTR
ncbi:MAG: PQQ enzyme repeat protein [Bacteroidetes bacterium ADurb.BinA174]|nr:MAG: PQQ enzyme repeat protein [Bacteroidetes bacterium ADurb.BinA174]